MRCPRDRTSSRVAAEMSVLLQTNKIALRIAQKTWCDLHIPIRYFEAADE
jgi:hypothetical protein